MITEELIPIVMFIGLTIVMIAFFAYRARHREQIQLTLRQAIEQGQTLSPELIERLSGAVHPVIADLRRGAVFLSIGVALVLFAFVLDEAEAVRPLLACSAFPLTVGAAYIALWYRGRDAS
ncbi:MAG: DUF6249 domain-containing protein [Pseudomonadota bacterium]